MTGFTVPAHGPHIYWVFGFVAELNVGLLRVCSSALSHSTDAGRGVEPVLSCGSDVGGAELDELYEEVVDRPGPRLVRNSPYRIVSEHRF